MDFRTPIFFSVVCLLVALTTGIMYLHAVENDTSTKKKAAHESYEPLRTSLMKTRTGATERLPIDSATILRDLFRRFERSPFSDHPATGHRLLYRNPEEIRMKTTSRFPSCSVDRDRKTGRELFGQCVQVGLGRERPTPELFLFTPSLRGLREGLLTTGFVTRGFFLRLSEKI